VAASRLTKDSMIFLDGVTAGTAANSRGRSWN